MGALLACTVPVGRSQDPSGSTAGSTSSPETSAQVSADPTDVATPGPSADHTPEPPQIAPPAFTWRRHVLPGLDYRSVLSHRGRFLALGSARDDQEEVSVLHSDDGLTWRSLARRPFDGQYPTSMTMVDGRLIVIAERRLGPESFENVVWSSSDGNAWTVWIDPARAPNPHSFARIGDRWLMESDYGEGIQSSVDGTDWTTELPLHPAAEGAGFAVGPAGVLAPVTQGGENGPGRSWMFLSEDGSEWTESAFGDAADTWIGRAAANDSGYVAIGLGSYQTAPSTSRAWWSADGAVWERSAVPDDFEQFVFYPTEIITYGSGFLATVNPREEGPSRMLWSSDGRVWEYVDGGPDIVYEGTGLVVDDRRVLWYGYESNDLALRTLWEATAAD